MSSVQSAIRAANNRGEKAMGLFLTNGFPDPDSTLPLLDTLARSGADFIELGMPFSDPLAEGRPVQRASERALRQGVRMKDTLATAERFRSRNDTPVLLMGYINPIFHYGLSNFCRDARSSGISGLILPDVPLEEGRDIETEAERHGLELVYLIAPTTPPERVAEIDERARGFVYAVSVTGITGSGLGEIESVERYLESARSIVRRNPLMVGFGIRTHDDARRLSRHTDGFIVGSALIDEIERRWDQENASLEDRLESIGEFARRLKYGTLSAL